MIRSVNSIPFSSTKETYAGNEYNKCNVGKTVGLVAGVGHSIYALSNLKKPQMQQVISNAAKNSPLSESAIKRSGGTFAVIMALGIWTGIGAVVDHFINKSRRKEADLRASHAPKN